MMTIIAITDLNVSSLNSNVTIFICHVVIMFSLRTGNTALTVPMMAVIVVALALICSINLDLWCGVF